MKVVNGGFLTYFENTSYSFYLTIASMIDGFQYETALDQRHMFLHQPLKRRKLLTSTTEMDHQYEEDSMQRRPSMEHSSTTHGSPYQDYHSDDKNYLYHSVMLEPWENHILWDELDPEG